MDPNSSSFFRFQCILHDSGILFKACWNFYTFLRVVKFPESKELGPNFLGEPIIEKVRVICCSLVCFNFKSLVDLRSLSFIRFQCILHDWGVLFPKCWNFYTFLRVLKFPETKQWVPNFWGEPIMEKIWVIWWPLLCFIFKSFVELYSASFIRFQCIVHDWGALS